jgi:hypothetical protein
VIPIFNKEKNVSNIENYRPISNQCSTSKLFEKLILQRIMQINDLNQTDNKREIPTRF